MHDLDFSAGANATKNLSEKEALTDVPECNPKSTESAQSDTLPTISFGKEFLILWGKIAFGWFLNFVLPAIDEVTDLYSAIRYFK